MISKKIIVTCILLSLFASSLPNEAIDDNSETIKYSLLQAGDSISIDTVKTDTIKTDIVEPKVIHQSTGYATWYGGAFHGNKTYSGERFNQYALTAAHNSFKMGTMVRVTNMSNNKSVIVKINDKGAFTKHGIAMDLSSAAFESIANKKQGRIKIKIEKLSNG